MSVSQKIVEFLANVSGHLPNGYFLLAGRARNALKITWVAIRSSKRGYRSILRKLKIPNGGPPGRLHRDVNTIASLALSIGRQTSRTMTRRRPFHPQRHNGEPCETRPRPSPGQSLH